MQNTAISESSSPPQPPPPSPASPSFPSQSVLTTPSATPPPPPTPQSPANSAVETQNNDQQNDSFLETLAAEIEPNETIDNELLNEHLFSEQVSLTQETPALNSTLTTTTKPNEANTNEQEQTTPDLQPLIGQEQTSTETHSINSQTNQQNDKNESSASLLLDPRNLLQ